MTVYCERPLSISEQIDKLERERGFYLMKGTGRKNSNKTRIGNGKQVAKAGTWYGTEKTIPRSLSFDRDNGGFRCKGIIVFSYLQQKSKKIDVMNYTDYEKALSVARLNRYLHACEGDKDKSLSLYRYNVKLCQGFYGILSMFEVVLRNAINEHYKNHFGDDDWIRTQMCHGGMLENCPQLNDIRSYISIIENSGRCTNDRLVSSVNFGFWTYLFNRQPFRKGGQSLLSALPNRTRGLGQRVIYNELLAVKNFRNRIAHYEPICFDVMGNRSVNFATYNYNLIMKYVCFLGYNKHELFLDIDDLSEGLMAQMENI